MKRINVISIALIGIFAILSTACVKEINPNDPLGLEGTPIVFSAATTFDNGVETRAEYSGLFGSSPKTERIEWRANDPIKIIYNGSTGSYKVTANGTQEAAESRADVSPVSGTSPLTWTSGGSHVFYALYPNNANGSLNGAVVSGTIPATQDVSESKTITVSGVKKYQPDTEHYGFMFGYLSLTATAESIELPFKPAFTTFEFKLKRKSTEAEKKLTKVEVFTDATSGTKLTGGFNFTIPNALTLPSTINTTGTLGNKITVNFTSLSGGGYTLKSTEWLDFSVLALPIDQQQVKVAFFYSDGSSRTLSLKDGSGNWYPFTGGKKYIITNENVLVGETWEYIIDEIPDKIAYGHDAITATNVFTYDVKSYKIKNGDASTKYPVAWEMQYAYAISIDPDTGEITWSPWSATWPTTPFTQTNIVASGAGYNGTTYQSGYSTLPTESTGSTSGGAGDATRAVLATADPRGTSSDYFDLSMHPCYGNKDATC